MTEVVLVALGDLDRLFKPGNALLEIVAVDQVALSILQALLAGLKSNLLPVALLRFFVAALVRDERPTCSALRTMLCAGTKLCAGRHGRAACPTAR